MITENDLIPGVTKIRWYAVHDPEMGCYDVDLLVVDIVTDMLGMLGPKLILSTIEERNPHPQSKFQIQEPPHEWPLHSVIHWLNQSDDSKDPSYEFVTWKLYETPNTSLQDPTLGVFG